MRYFTIKHSFKKLNNLFEINIKSAEIKTKIMTKGNKDDYVKITTDIRSTKASLNPSKRQQSVFRSSL